MIAVAQPDRSAETLDFSIGGIFQRSATLFGWYFALAVLAGGASLLCYAFSYATALDYVLPIRRLLPQISYRGASYFRLSAFSAVLVHSFTDIMIVMAAWQRLSGQRVRIGLAAGRALRCFLPVTLIRVGPSVGLTVGGTLMDSGSWPWIAAGFALVAPSLSVGMIWFVAPSINVIENRSVRGSCRRSAELTRGHRWKLFGIFMLLTGLYLITQHGLAGLYSRYGATIYFAVAYVQFGIYVAFSVISAVVIYYGLRAAKEGLGVERISAVFD
jgi:hypothetical protein